MTKHSVKLYVGEFINDEHAFGALFGDKNAVGETPLTRRVHTKLP